MKLNELFKNSGYDYSLFSTCSYLTENGRFIVVDIELYKHDY